MEPIGPSWAGVRPVFNNGEEVAAAAGAMAEGTRVIGALEAVDVPSMDGFRQVSCARASVVTATTAVGHSWANVRDSGSVGRVRNLDTDLFRYATDIRRRSDLTAEMDSASKVVDALMVDRQALQAQLRSVRWERNARGNVVQRYDVRRDDQGNEDLEFYDCWFVAVNESNAAANVNNDMRSAWDEYDAWYMSEAQAANHGACPSRRSSHSTRMHASSRPLVTSACLHNQQNFAIPVQAPKRRKVRSRPSLPSFIDDDKACGGVHVVPSVH